MEVTNIELSKKNMLVVARNSIKVMRICCIFRFYFVFFSSDILQRMYCYVWNASKERNYK